ncbi:MAG: hypothetical protein CMF69_06990 [Magnetovibrio sp.]|nr:hypothetical protein [Magnetovibrio sp.]
MQQKFRQVMKHGAFFACAMFFAFSISSVGQAAGWPKKAINYVVVFSPGGGSDTFARIVVKWLSKELGVPVNVINKPGGNQIPAINYVAKASPDGYTLMQEQQAASALKVMLDIPNADELIRNRTFGPMIGGGANALVVNNKVPFKTLGEMVNFAKKDPSKFTAARTGGSFSHMINTQFFEFVGIPSDKVRWVDYKGTGPSKVALAGNHIMFVGTGANSIVTMHRSGDVKALAVTGPRRLSSLPKVPTMEESGFPGFEMQGWYGISGPPGLPKEVVQRLDEVAKKLSKDKGFINDLDKLAAFPFYKSPADAKKLVLEETEFYRKMAQAKKKN